ncbi:MAG: DUF2892 domain-containing protein [Candidatus Thioglobus sp.]|uniref:YgaP family membrane protein n=1 Tax=Candidatus Thioglobus sp. TaxID=2026721 RepID=UPI00260762DC|nr:DUF2892 domain-containing protein [Candidatus Thioglobus sp.]MDC9726522.1 DUF2892 domain-containing protein [Candidatus Thioglobus sp.]
MIQNVGRKDAQIRTVLGAVLIILAIFVSSYLALVGLFLIATALAEWCVIYKLLNISTYTALNSSFRYR